jgi:hypothetical protein
MHERQSYPGLIIHESRLLRKGADITVPPHVFVASDYRHFYGEAILQHAYGHFLQYKKHGAFFYYLVITPASIWAALWHKDDAWPELEANRLAHHFFGKQSFMGTKYFPL